MLLSKNVFLGNCAILCALVCPAVLLVSCTSQVVEDGLAIEDCAGIIIEGVKAGDQFGSAIDGSVDIDGDEMADIIIGAYSSDMDALSGGAAFLFSGSLLTADSGLVSARHCAAKFVGNPFMSLGINVALLEDFTGDGLGEIALSAVEDSDGASSLYIYLGRRMWTDSLLPEDADIQINESHEHTAFSFKSLATIPKCRLAPRGGILAGIPYGARRSQSAYGFEDGLQLTTEDYSDSPKVWKRTGGEGSVRFLLGEELERLHGRVKIDEVGLELIPKRAEMQFGESIAYLGDINGDSHDEVAIASSREDISDEWELPLISLYTFRGRNGNPSTFEMLSQTQGVPRTPSSTSPTLEGLGDIDGDGLADYAIGRPFDENKNGRSGRVYVVLGRRTGEIDTQLSFGSSCIIEGAEESGLFGVEIAGIGDVNADGLDDFLVSASAERVNRHSRGVVYLFLGRKAGWEETFSCRTADAIYYSRGPDRYFGHCLSELGDLNQDGFLDFCISAAGTRERKSRVYIVYGGPDIGK